MPEQLLLVIYQRLENSLVCSSVQHKVRMKAFIFVALVASVAARSLDLETLRLVKEKSLLSTPVVSEDLLLKEKLINQQQLVLGQQQQQENLIDTTVLPVDRTVGGIYDYSVAEDRVLTIDELYTTQLFKEYLSLPLFRQYIQYPAFQRFIQSVYFQRFYNIPAYKQYFYNPVLFYKYVLPIVQLFNTEYSIPTSTVYGQEEDVLGLKTLVDDVLLKNKNFLPYAYNRFSRQSELPFTTTESTNYKFLLDRLYKNLFVNKQVVGDVAQIKTDVTVIPSTERVVVEPITNKIVVEEPKQIIDVQVNTQVPIADTIVPVVDSIVLNERQFVIVKDLLRQQIITPEVYQAVVLGKIEFTTVLRQVLERRGITFDLINLIINRFVTVDSLTPFTTEQDVLLLKELLRQNIITPQVYQTVLVGKVDFLTLLRQIVVRRDVIDTIVPVVDSTILNERQLLIVKDLLRQQIISQETYQSIVLGRVEFTTLLRQVLERRGITFDLINLIINRFVTLEQTVGITQQDVLLLKELLRQNIITPQVYQTVLVGQVDFFTLLRQIVVRRDVIDTIVPVVDSAVLTERQIILLKELVRQQFIAQEVYEAVVLGRVEFTTVLRQVLERRGLTTDLINLIISRLFVVDQTVGITQQDVYLLKELLRQNLITSEIYQAVIYGKFDFYTLLRQIIFRGDVIDSVVPYSSKINRYFGGNDRFDYINKYFGYKNLYNTEVPTFRDNIYNRFPITA